jgi:lipoprotein-anchoring transpeptidase ErfK/SrfK
LAEHSEWTAGSDSKSIAEHSRHGVSARIAPYQITVVYDPKTSQGTFYLLGKSGKESKTVLQANVVVGGQDHVTPTGDFHASFWETDHISKQYGWKADTAWSKSIMGLNAFGPYQLHIGELEKRGIYIHGTMGPGWSHTTAVSGIAVSQSSHGCVRMSNADVIALHSLIPEPQGISIKITTNPNETPKK